MRIWLINIGEEIPSDTGTPRLLRTGLLAHHLADRGHDVTWWNATFNHQRKHQRAAVSRIDDVRPNFRIALLFGRAYARNISVSRILSQIENAREFARLAPKQPRPDVIMCGYPPIELAAAAVRFARREKIPIAIDFRDLWPDVIAEQATGALRWPAAPLIAVWRRQQAYIVRNASAIVGVTDAFVDWALDAGARKRGALDRAFHLAVDPKPPDATQIREAEAFWDAHGVRSDDGRMVACFAGTLSRRLDIDTLVKAATLLPPEHKRKLRLVIAGKGDLDADLKRIAGGEDCIVFPGWRTAAEIHALLRRCHVGTIPYRSTHDFVRHYPNKLGEYLGAGLPVMTGLVGQVRTLLTERNLGYFYRECDPVSAAQCLSAIIENVGKIEDQRPRARAAFEDLFDGKRIYPAFADYLEQLPAAAAEQRIDIA